jgi:hypothetical protein
MATFSGNELWEIFSRSFRASPRTYADYQRGGEGWENTPVYDMLESSPGVNLARQYLPPVAGGYSPQERQAFADARSLDPRLQRYTVERGRVPVGDNLERASGGSKRAALAQAAGALGADFVADGVRNIWWFLNAPQALASLATQQAMATASPDLKVASGLAERTPWVKNRNLRMAATVPAWLAVSLGVGNFARPEGYKAVLPSTDDPTVSANPLQEAAERYLFGRTGALLPYDQFVQERPDVSRDEYESYKAYLHGSKAPLKATADGIHGPEITFMGKSLPVLTTVLPAAAAVLGTRYGLRQGARRLSGLDRRNEPVAGAVNRLEQAEDLRRTWKTSPAERKDEAYLAYSARQDANDAALLQGALLYGGGATAATAATGQALELLRRAMNASANELPTDAASELPRLRS